MFSGLSLGVMLGMCQGHTDESAVAMANALTKVPQAAKDSINEFGIDTVRKLSAKSGKNFMISPWSVQECLGMVRLGARGSTERELAAFLKQSAKLKESAQSLKQLRNASSALFKSDQIRQANAIWVRKDFSPLPSYAEETKQLFGTAPKGTTFPNPGLKLINGFVSETTRGKIPKLFDNLEADTRMVLVNAISFQDKWSSPFKKSDTKPLPFTPPASAARNVMTMSARGEYMHGKNSWSEYVSFPYKSGLQMLIVLPNKGMTIARVLFEPNFLKNVATSMRSDPGAVYIPRWQSEFSWDLKGYMQQNGARSCFDPASANFSGMAREGLFVGQALQKTFIKVDEEGTEAAAATGTTMRPTSARVETPFEFRANRPFAYFIWSPTGVIYFAGVVNNPAA